MPEVLKCWRKKNPPWSQISQDLPEKTSRLLKISYGIPEKMQESSLSYKQSIQMECSLACFFFGGDVHTIFRIMQAYHQ